MNKSIRALLLSAGLGAAAAAAGGYYTTRLFVDAAVARELPRSVRRMQDILTGGRIVKDDSLQQRLKEAGAQLRNATHEQVELTGIDGVRLVGHWFYNPNAKRVLVLMHGWRSAWFNDFSLSAPIWFQNDCSILFAEQRAQNASGGDCLTFGLLERYDCREWALWADRRCKGRLPIYLSGISMGASTVLMAASLPFPPSVRGVIADCGFTSPKAIMQYVAEHNLHLSYRLFGSMAERMFRERVGIAPDAFSTTEALARTKLPVLLIHGEDDHFVPVEMTHENYEACAGEKRLLLVPGAGHGLSFCVDETAYKNAVFSFWEAFDRKD